MTEAFEVRLLAVEAAISMDAALTAAEQIAGHGIVESTSFERLMTLLEDAAAAVDQIRRMTEPDAIDVAMSARPASPCDRGPPAVQLDPTPARLMRPTATGSPALRLISSR
jgi:hypothetical protein